MEPLPTQTLLRLLQLYESALGDLRVMRDPAVANLIDRLALHRDEVVAALADPARRTPRGADTDDLGTGPVVD